MTPEGSRRNVVDDRPYVKVVDPRTEYRVNPLGIDARSPRLSWRLCAQMRGVLQSAYQIRVATSPAALAEGKDLAWDSDQVFSDRSIHIPYAGSPVRTGQRYHWSIRVWDQRDVVSPWSEPAWWEMGLLDEADWRAEWIAPTGDFNTGQSTHCPMLRRVFELEGGIASARAYVTSFGLYELYLNGQRVGDALFTPGWTSFERRLQYQAYDVTALLAQGANCAGIVLGDGWYRMDALNMLKQPNNGKPFALLFQLEVLYRDGRRQTVISDGAWSSATGPILRSELYHGEVYDARLRRRGWATPAYQGESWTPVAMGAPSKPSLVATVGPPVRRIAEIKPIEIITTPKGICVVDFGQNLTGWVRLRIRGAAGTRVVLRHFEVLDAEGEPYRANLREAGQRVEYVLDSSDEEVFEPHFTFHGFRYVAVEGFPGVLDAGDVTGIVIHSDIAKAGSLQTSNALINQLQSNIEWSLRGNYVDVPTDCPQRDERLGWCFDAELFMPTAALNRDVATFFTKWLGDLATDQLPDGAVPMEVPRADWNKRNLKAWYEAVGHKADASHDIDFEFVGAPGYGDAATIIPWNLYLAYGDTHILSAQFESMRRWVDYIGHQAGDDHIWNPILSLGDWLDTSTIESGKLVGSTPDDLMATAHYARSTDILRRAAAVLGRTDDAAQYGRLHAAIVQAFQARFVSDDGKVGDGSQTAYVLALDFDLLSEEIRPRAARRLAEGVREAGSPTTGIGGTARLLNVLSRFGYHDEAYRLLMRTELPSWLYPLTRGATTIWERWDGIKPDGSFQDPRMNSFNHYALGAVGEWMYTVMAGIALDPTAPGYKHVLIQPRPDGGLTHVTASHLTPYGEVSSSWRIDAGNFYLSVAIPPNSSATVTLPDARLEQLLEAGKSLTRSNGIRAMRQVGSNTVMEIGSGQYGFSFSTNR